MNTLIKYVTLSFITIITSSGFVVDESVIVSVTLPEITVTANDPYHRTKYGKFPKEVFKGVKVDSAIQWNDTILLAALINTESQSGTFFEKKLIAQTVVDRAKNNFMGYGTSIAQQVFAPAQFSGVVKRSNGYRWCYYFHNKNGRYNNPQVANRYNYNPSNTKKVTIKRNGRLIQLSYQDIAFENYQAAREILKGNRAIEQTVLYFCNPKISTDNKQVLAVMRNKIHLPQKTKHIFAGGI